MGEDPVAEELVDQLASREMAVAVAAQAEQFTAALRTIADAGQAGPAIPLLLLEISQILLAGARLGAHTDFTPRQEFQPDVGPDPDLDDLRLGLTTLLGSVDTYGFVFDPYDPEMVQSQLSDDLTSIASDLENGLRHYRLGNVEEALWWWQFSYVSSWGNLAGAALNALLCVVSHDRLDADADLDAAQVAEAERLLAHGETADREA